MILFQQLLQAAQKNSSQPATHYLGKDISFGDFRRKVAQLSYLYLAELGVGSRVAIMASNCPAVPKTFFALTNIRSLTIPIDPSAEPEEIALWLKESEATHLAVSSDLLPKARELLSSQHLSLPIIEIEKKQGGEYDQSFTPPVDNPPKDTDLILLLRTAGVSGPAKLCAFDHKSIGHAAVSLRALYGLGAADRILGTINWSHPFSWFHEMLFPLLNGATCVIDHGLEEAEFVSFVTKSKTTRLVTEPTRATAFLNLCRLQGLKTPTLKSIVVGIGSIPGKLRDLSDTQKVPVLGCYGQTENAWTIAMGRPLPGIKCKVVDTNGDEITGKDIPKVGQLAVMGPTSMKRYHSLKKPEYEKATKQALRGTWLYTGDIAEISGDGDTLQIRLIGRKESVLDRGGSYVSPEPIDPALTTLAGAVDGAGFVLKDMKGKFHMACAVVKAEKSLLKEGDVLGHCRSKVSGDEIPQFAFFVESIPRLRIGSLVNRVKLARQFQGTAVDTLSAPPTSRGDRPPPRRSQPSREDFTVCDLADLEVDQPLPVTIHAYFQNRMIPFRPIGTRIDRPTYDRLEQKKIEELFVLKEDLPKLQEWKRGLSPEAPIQPGSEGFQAARENAHQELLKFFMGAQPEGTAAHAVLASKTLVDEMMKVPYAARPLSEILTRSKGTVDHSVNVAVLSSYLALHQGYEHVPILQNIAAGALLHEIGTIKMPIAEKDSPADITAKIKLQAQIGAKMLEEDPEVPEEVRLIVAQCMECFDGSGYPKALRANQIYDLARIVAIAHAFEELASSGTGDVRARYNNAIAQLDSFLAAKFDPAKLEKALRVLRLGS